MTKQIARQHEFNGSKAVQPGAEGDRSAAPRGAVGMLMSGDVEAIAEATARRVLELAREPARRVLELAREPARTFALVDARDLAHELGVSLHYVYAHASELGAMRLGSGPRARIRFDLDRARQALEAQSASPVRRRAR